MTGVLYLNIGYQWWIERSVDSETSLRFKNEQRSVACLVWQQNQNSFIILYEIFSHPGPAGHSFSQIKPCLKFLSLVNVPICWNFVVRISAMRHHCLHYKLYRKRTVDFRAKKKCFIILALHKSQSVTGGVQSPVSAVTVSRSCYLGEFCNRCGSLSTPCLNLSPFIHAEHVDRKGADF